MGLLRKLWAKHSEKIIAFLLAQASQWGDFFLTKFVPIPGDILWLGVLATILCSLVTVFAVGIETTRIKAKAKENRMHARWYCVVWMVLTLIIALFARVAFFAVESAWKKPETSPDKEEFLYWFVEPLTYGLTFAALAAFVVFAFTLGNDFYLELQAADDPNTEDPNAPADNPPANQNAILPQQNPQQQNPQQQNPPQHPPQNQNPEQHPPTH